MLNLGLVKKGVVGPLVSPKIQRRIHLASTHDLVEWLEVGVMGLGRAVSDARRNADDPTFGEIEDGAVVVAAVAAELRRRV